ncbi:hypothetical protein CH63R_12796 [Colletotrichum higginsianum IMI 349063]|uniref:Uncharacterized protein n=1 Tax=Colletotrichum higginsianum (strain IMI 349063) TaxID=759273 RepID=A0A1B7XV62_COLHI|nr:hypothetical protein CH63R_12796 [Colletotrichum higginsianum IMI 349063]OBR03669.1 hypothetical protein CH63R_12796 [Colletotrichum higginsianum IMI 349063]
MTVVASSPNPSFLSRCASAAPAGPPGKKSRLIVLVVLVVACPWRNGSPGCDGIRLLAPGGRQTTRPSFGSRSIPNDDALVCWLDASKCSLVRPLWVPVRESEMKGR